MDNFNNGPVNVSKQGAYNANNGGQDTHLDQSNNQQGQKINWVGNMAPGAVIGTRQNVRIKQAYDYSKYGLRVEVLEYQKLTGSTNIYGAQSLYFMTEANIKCRQIAIYMLNSACKIEAGAMSYFQGPMTCKSGLGNASKFVNQLLTSKLTGEKLAIPEYSGSGILVLEPSFKHFFVGELQPGEQIICDKGLFYAASTSVTIEPCFAGSVSGSMLGGEGIFQQLITGPGMIILELPVPMEEINICHLNNDILRVDGNFAVLRDGGIQMSVEPVSQSYVGSAMSGEGLVNVYRGTGDVWLAPTIKAYDALRLAKISGGDIAKVDMNTSTGRAKPKTN